MKRKRTICLIGECDGCHKRFSMVELTGYSAGTPDIYDTVDLCPQCLEYAEADKDIHGNPIEIFELEEWEKEERDLWLIKGLD